MKIESAAEFLQKCTRNFDLDLSTQIIKSHTQQEMHQSGCGWDEGHQWHYEASIPLLLTRLNEALQDPAQRLEFELIGKEIDYALGPDGSVEGIDPATRAENSVKLKFSLDRDKYELILKPA